MAQSKTATHAPRMGLCMSFSMREFQDMQTLSPLWRSTFRSTVRIPPRLKGRPMNDPTALDTTGSLGCGDCSGDAGGDVHRSRQVSVPYYVKALAMALPAFCFGLTLRGWIDFLSHIPSGRTDFRHLYATAYMVRTERGPTKSSDQLLLGVIVSHL